MKQCGVSGGEKKECWGSSSVCFCAKHDFVPVLKSQRRVWWHGCSRHAIQPLWRRPLPFVIKPLINLNALHVRKQNKILFDTR